MLKNMTEDELSHPRWDWVLRNSFEPLFFKMWLSEHKIDVQKNYEKFLEENLLATRLDVLHMKDSQVKRAIKIIRERDEQLYLRFKRAIKNHIVNQSELTETTQDNGYLFDTENMNPRNWEKWFEEGQNIHTLKTVEHVFIEEYLRKVHELMLCEKAIREFMKTNEFP